MVWFEPIKALGELRNKTEGMEWTMPDEDAWKRAHSRAAGSGGPDGLSGGELRALPSGVIRLYARVAERRLETGKPAVSHVVLETSQLAKTRESVHGGELASHIGPDGVVAVV